ncbi:MAG: D-glycero-beta-D-manno-heptose,7-bisphosphate 7-phosphatase [Acidimicrobiales bacterium]|nr:D-glycero-beta-D-manno-heptose,7-bisphosphate 7-phosphatase [Acidimicrobiales bacterium]
MTEPPPPALPDLPALPAEVRHVLVDRDGVLNRELDDGWLAEPGGWRWEQGALAGLGALARRGIAVSVVTNQSGIGRGLVASADVARIHAWLAAELHRMGVDLRGIYVCPHAPDARCACRKPAPGLLDQAVRASAVPKSATLLVGDAGRDLAAAGSAGIAAVLVRTGKGRDTEAGGGWPGPVYDDLAAVAGALR